MASLIHLIGFNKNDFIGHLFWENYHGDLCCLYNRCQYLFCFALLLHCMDSLIIIICHNYHRLFIILLSSLVTLVYVGFVFFVVLLMPFLYVLIHCG